MVTTVTISNALAEMTSTAFEFSSPNIRQLTFDYFSAASHSTQTADIEFFKDTGGGNFQHISAASDTIAEIVLYDRNDGSGQPMVTITGLSVVYSTLAGGLGDGSNSNANYFALVGLVNGDVVINGSDNPDLQLEVGTGGTATVNGGAGDDVVRVWQQKNVVADGGAGSDTLAFQSWVGGPYPNEPSTGAVVNLTTGTGTNAFGGTLSLTGIENVIGTDQADTLTGNGAANKFGDGVYDIGADTIDCGAGNDIVNFAELNGGGVHADGGADLDTLAINFAFISTGLERLDLANPANNTGIFDDDVFSNFEVFVPGSGFFVAANHTFAFLDTNDNAGRTVVAMGQANNLTLRGGNDAAILLTTGTPANYSVSADGGAGSDTLQFEVKFNVANNFLDLVHQASNSGVFANSTFAGFELFRHVEADGGFASTQRFTFRGDDNAQTVIGAYGIDDIRTAGGSDVLNGGLGKDILAGGAGKDTFIFNTAPGLANLDQILDLSVRDDTIRLENAIFTGIGANGVLAAARFFVGAHAHDASDRIIYNSNTGALLYDSNGSAAGHEVQFATLARHLALTHADFVVI